MHVIVLQCLNCPSNQVSVFLPSPLPDTGAAHRWPGSKPHLCPCPRWQVPSLPPRGISAQPGPSGSLPFSRPRPPCLPPWCLLCPLLVCKTPLLSLLPPHPFLLHLQILAHVARPLGGVHSHIDSTQIQNRTFPPFQKPHLVPQPIFALLLTSESANNFSYFWTSSKWNHSYSRCLFVFDFYY